GPAAQGRSAEPCPLCGTERRGQFCEGCGYDFRTGTPPRSAVHSRTPGGEAGPRARPTPGGPPGPRSAPGGPGRYAGQAPVTSPTGAGGSGPPASRHAAGTRGQNAFGAPTWTAVVTADHDYFRRVLAAGGPDASTIEYPAYCPERRFRLTGREMRVGRRSVSRGLDPEIDLTGPPTDPGISHLHAVLVAQPDGTWSVLDPGSSNGTQVNGADIEIGVPVPLRPGDRICIGAWTALTIQA